MAADGGGDRGDCGWMMMAAAIAGLMAAIAGLMAAAIAGIVGGECPPLRGLTHRSRESNSPSIPEFEFGIADG
jgi:hypothetical protein